MEVEADRASKREEGMSASSGGVAEGGTEAEAVLVVSRVEADEREAGEVSVVAGSIGRGEEAEVQVRAEARGASSSSR